jgi:hypothetical protein
MFVDGVESLMFLHVVIHLVAFPAGVIREDSPVMKLIPLLPPRILPRGIGCFLPLDCGIVLKFQSHSHCPEAV